MQSKTSPEHNAVKLQGFLDNTDFKLPDGLKLFFDLLPGSDTVQARLIVMHLKQDTARELLRVIAVQIRSLISPKSCWRSSTSLSRRHFITYPPISPFWYTNLQQVS